MPKALVRSILLVIIVLGVTCADAAPTETRDSPHRRFLIGMTAAEIRALPASGSAWRSVAANARARVKVDLARPDSRSAAYAFCAALRYVRTGEDAYRAKVIGALKQVEGWSGTFYYSAVNRQLSGWVLAADLVGYRTEAWRDFLSWIRYAPLAGNGRWTSMYKTAHDAANNHGAVGRLSHLAIDLFLRDSGSTSPFGTPSGLSEDIRWMKGFLGDRTAYGTRSGDGAAPYGQFGANGWTYSQTWTHDKTAWAPINPASAGPAKDGAFPMDAYREGTPFTTDGTTTKLTSDGVMYSFLTGMAVVDTATLLAANGHSDVWQWSNQAVRRWRDFLDRQRYNHPYPSVTGHADPILNHIYGTNYPAVDSQGYGLTGTRWLTQNPNWLKRRAASSRPRGAFSVGDARPAE